MFRNEKLEMSTDTVEKTRCPACGCVGKNPTYEILSVDDIQEQFKLLKIGHWRLSSDNKSISRKFKCRNWQGAINFINFASLIAESPGVDHHPDIHLTNYREIEVVLSTHATGGLTLSDFNLAKGLDTVVIDYSPSWLKQNPEFMP